MSDLLKEAIADAKAVRETALENAKMALEEAFTPHLKSMLSAKLSEEDVEEGMHDEDDPRREDDDEDDVDEMGMKPRREDDDEEKKDESVNEEEELEEEEEIDEQSTSSGIGKGTGVKMASASDEEDPGKGKIKESVEAMQNELNEYKEAVTFLREKLHEVNILNAKLLYTNRLFKEFVLSNGQKMKIVETFDRAQTTREIKLVYSTLAESFNDRGEINKKRSVKESASRKTNTTKPQTKIISEEDNVANRFKKLAGILKD